MGVVAPLLCGSNKEPAEELEYEEIEGVLLLVISEVERSGLVGDLIIVLTWLVGLFLFTAAARI